MTDLTQPVAWKYRWKIDGEYVGWRYSDASNAHPSLDGFEEIPLYDADSIGTLIPRADADLAMALMVEKAGKAIRSEAQISPYHNGMTAVYQRGLSDGFEAAAQVVDALVPASALADLKALRDERDRLDAVTNTLSEMWEGEQTARHSAEAELATLRAQVERLTGALKSMPSRVSSVTLDDGPKSLSKDNLGAWVDGITTCEKVVQRAVDAAITEGAAP